MKKTSGKQIKYRLEFVPAADNPLTFVARS